MEINSDLIWPVKLARQLIDNHKRESHRSTPCTCDCCVVSRALLISEQRDQMAAGAAGAALRAQVAAAERKCAELEWELRQARGEICYVCRGFIEPMERGQAQINTAPAAASGGTWAPAHRKCLTDPFSTEQLRGGK